MGLDFACKLVFTMAGYPWSDHFFIDIISKGVSFSITYGDRRLLKTEDGRYLTVRSIVPRLRIPFILGKQLKEFIQ